MERPVLRSQTLMVPAEAPGEKNRRIHLDSPAWEQWLGDDDRLRVELSIRRTPITLSLRKEINGRHKTAYWYAYTKIEGKTRKKYVGPSADLTLERLHAVASAFLDL